MEVLDCAITAWCSSCDLARRRSRPRAFLSFKAQATESLEHAQQSGELLTGLGGHPSQKIPKIDETNQHSVQNLLSESLIHEEKAISLYNKLLECSEGKSLYIEEYAREMIKTEEMHSIEIKKLLRDYDQ